MPLPLNPGSMASACCRLGLVGCAVSTMFARFEIARSRLRMLLAIASAAAAPAPPPAMAAFLLALLMFPFTCRDWLSFARAFLRTGSSSSSTGSSGTSARAVSILTGVD